ncbi:hypothetical protein BWK58_05165 [Flavobacterium columnare]|nr:hypothetical protein BWK58_05165 [Flavobacterium columnare]
MISQSKIPALGSNIADPNIDKFVGTWYWEGNGKSLQFILKKENVDFMPIIKMDYKLDMIVGVHKYIENGVIIEDSTPFKSGTYADKKTTVSGSTINNGANLLTGSIKHLTKDKFINFKILYIDSKHIKILKLENPYGFHVRKPEDAPFDYSISLPSDIILTRQ